MAIDSTLFGLDIPGGTVLNAGDTFQLGVVAGPKNVRSGRGTAVLKSVIVGTTSPVAGFIIHVQNSDWIDPMSTFAANALQATSFDEGSGNVQVGSNCPLNENSTWTVTAECVTSGTAANAESMFCLLDVDYPQVSAIVDPTTVTGFPTSIKQNVTVNIGEYGTIGTSGWTSTNVDFFKAGYEYCIKDVEVKSGTDVIAFVAYSNAAGMGGLQRIVPINGLSFGVKKNIVYSSKLRKGPMDVKILAIGNTATSGYNMPIIHDYVKRGI